MSCERQDELLDALGRGFVGPELDAHTTACNDCGEIRLVAAALLDDNAQAMSEAHLPSSGTMWWRMRVRHRHDVASRARVAMLVGQAATVFVALALVVTFFGSDLAIELRQLVTTIRLSTPLLAAAATLLSLVPLAGWVAIRQK
ncbi:MAG TPA: hypothetical protein VNI54_03520 [Thermoanaerobaculia bacterium]|nr:hypothetical protein [Thermoanaerobaculia bacterium]